MLRKKHFSIYIVILIIVIISIYTLYDYNLKQKKLLEKAIATVTEIDQENLKVEYNTNFTNTNLEVRLTTNSIDNITYSFNHIDYIQYDSVINVEDNCTIYVKYMNSYGTYSSNEYLIEIKNIDKIQPEITKKDIVTSTNSLTINIDAFDNTEIAKIEASIGTKDYIEVTDGSYTFEGLEQGKEYTVNIIVTDIAGNIVKDELKGTTKKRETSSNSSKSTFTNKSNTNSINKSTKNSSNSNTSNKKTDTPQTWNTNTYYGGEIHDSSGFSGGYWMYGEEMDFNGIDMSDWTFNN